MSVAFEATSFGPGSLVRFRQRKSHRWEHAIYRGVEERDGRPFAYTFSETPLGPITRWMLVWPEHIEAAVVGHASVIERSDS